MADRSVKFWDRIAKRYSKKPVADEIAYQKKLHVTQAYFRPEMEVVEIGCGTGSTAIVHAPHVKHIRAVDISSKMLEIAQRKAERAGVENITFQRSSIDELEVPEESVDVVLGLSILHLVEEKEEVIAKVREMLKPGGLFVSSTSCIGDTMNFFRFIVPIGMFFGLMPLVKVFTTDELERSLTGGGFEIDYRWQPGKGDAVFIVAKKPV